MGELSALPNIGKVLEQQLVQADIHSANQLKEIGSTNAWLRIQAFDPSACYSRLCALEGAICSVRWHHLPNETKEELKQFYLAHKAPKL